MRPAEAISAAGVAPAPGPVAAGAPRRAGLRACAALLLLVLPFLCGACASILRLDPPPAELAVAMPVLGIPNARFWPDGSPEPLAREVIAAAGRQLAEARRLNGAQARLPPANFLALSGGGDDGAYGAGLLVGWTASGQRPYPST